MTRNHLPAAPGTTSPSLSDSGTCPCSSLWTPNPSNKLNKPGKSISSKCWRPWGWSRGSCYPLFSCTASRECILTLSKLSWPAEKGKNVLLTSLRLSFRRFVLAQKSCREAWVAQQILGVAVAVPGWWGQGWVQPATLSCPYSLDLQSAFVWGSIISHVLTGTFRHRKQFSSPKNKKNQFSSMHNCLLSLLNPHTPTSIVMHHLLCSIKGILHLQVISPALLLFSPLQEGFREHIQKDVFVPPPWVSVPRLPIKLSHKSSIIGSKT